MMRFNFPVTSGKGFFQADFKVITQISAPPPAPPGFFPAKEIFEKVVEKIVDSFLAEKEFIRLAGAAVPSPSRRGSEAVIGGPLLGILQGLVGFRKAFEKFFRARIFRVLIGMVLVGQATVGLFDFFSRGPGFESEEILKIPLQASAFISSSDRAFDLETITLAGRSRRS